MKKFPVRLVLLMGLCIVACVPQLAPVDMGTSFPPPIAFSTPPEMIVLPETEVYVVPQYDQDLFFYGGWWWRPWHGRWYRSLYYDSGWAFYNGVPGWYGGVYPYWRDNFRNHMWGGQRWDYHSVPYGDVRTNWKTWHNTGHYQQNWGSTGSYRHGVETRRDFRGFPQETRYQQTSVPTHQAPETKGQQASVPTRQAPPETIGRQVPVAAHQSPAAAQGLKSSVPTQPSVDLSKNKSPFAGVGRGSDARIQSNRGLQSRQSMSSKGKSDASKGDGGRGNIGSPR